MGESKIGLRLKNRNKKKHNERLQCITAGPQPEMFIGLSTRKKMALVRCASGAKGQRRGPREYNFATEKGMRTHATTAYAIVVCGGVRVPSQWPRREPRIDCGGKELFPLGYSREGSASKQRGMSQRYCTVYGLCTHNQLDDVPMDKPLETPACCPLVTWASICPTALLLMPCRNPHQLRNHLTDKKERFSHKRIPFPCV